ncbi:hypothetical protein E8E11_000173 [Didymella keratinophila]|nr:hypothetical protein E8E11_000173 [Didymella keratinophila]
MAEGEERQHDWVPDHMDLDERAVEGERATQPKERFSPYMNVDCPEMDDLTGRFARLDINQ